MYNSFLYGYGLTLAILNKIKKVNEALYVNDYLDFNTFLKEFLHAKSHKRILRDFNKYFNLSNEKIVNSHEEARIFLQNNLETICSIGFERWVSQNLFNENNNISDNIKFYTYILYNYWYYVIHKEVLSKKQTSKKLKDISGIIENKIESKENIYTLNFDTLLDNWLKPHHLHGTFALPLKNITDVILKYYNEEQFEYKYLFGTNGYEKYIRISKISNMNQNTYDLDFFIDNNLKLGHMLIYGVSFGKAEVINDEFLEEFPKHESNYIAKSVDGHIIHRLNELYLDGKVDKITVTYYCKEDLKSYKNILGDTKFNNIIEYTNCNKIFNI